MMKRSCRANIVLSAQRKGRDSAKASASGEGVQGTCALAQGSLEAEDFYWLGQSFRNLGVPVFSLLEGGYSPELPDLILAYLKGLEGK